MTLQRMHKVNWERKLSTEWYVMWNDKVTVSYLMRQRTNSKQHKKEKAEKWIENVYITEAKSVKTA